MSLAQGNKHTDPAEDRTRVSRSDQYLTCNTDNEKTANLVGLQSHKHSRNFRKKGKPVCRFGFPLPPLPKTMLLYPLEEDVDMYKKKNTELLKAMNEYKDNVDMTFEEFLENIAKMDFDNYIKCIRSSLKAPKVFLKRKTKEMRINLFNKSILLVWKANLDIQIVLEPYGCASYIVGYISKSQRCCSKRGSKRKSRPEETSPAYWKCIFKLC